MKSETLKFVPYHVGFSVADLDASVKWYEEKLGFKLLRRLFVEHIPSKIAFLLNGQFIVELFEVPGAAPLPEARRSPDLDLRTHGIKHLALGVKDVKKTIAVLKERGVDMAMESEVEGKPMAFIRDNTGNLIEINEIGSL